MNAKQFVCRRRPQSGPAAEECPGGWQGGPGPAAKEEPCPVTPPREAAEGRAERSGPDRVKQAAPRAAEAEPRPMERGGFSWAARTLLGAAGMLAGLAAIGGLAV